VSFPLYSINPEDLTLYCIFTVYRLFPANSAPEYETMLNAHEGRAEQKRASTEQSRIEQDKAEQSSI
jgi:hypothetical protein